MSNCITCKNKKDSFSVEWDYAQCETCATEEYMNDAKLKYVYEVIDVMIESNKFDNYTLDELKQRLA